MEGKHSGANPRKLPSPRPGSAASARALASSRHHPAKELSSPWTELDDDLLCKILSFLPDGTLWTVGSVCRSWRALSACHMKKCSLKGENGKCCGRDSQLWESRYPKLLRWLESLNPPIQPKLELDEFESESEAELVLPGGDLDGEGKRAVAALIEEMENEKPDATRGSWRERYAHALSTFKLDVGPSASWRDAQKWHVCQSCGNWMPLSLTYSAWLGCGGGDFPPDSEASGDQGLYWQWHEFAARNSDRHVLLKQGMNVEHSVCMECIKSKGDVATTKIGLNLLSTVKDWWEGEICVECQDDGITAEEDDEGRQRVYVIRSPQDLMTFVLFSLEDQKPTKKPPKFDGIRKAHRMVNDAGEVTIMDIVRKKKKKGKPGKKRIGVKSRPQAETSEPEQPKDDANLDDDKVGENQPQPYSEPWKLPVDNYYIVTDKWLKGDGKDVALLGGYIMKQAIQAAECKNRSRCEALMGQLFSWTLVRIQRENSSQYSDDEVD